MLYKLSIIVPVYNTAPYLRECLDSVLQQSLWQAENATQQVDNNTLQADNATQQSDNNTLQSDNATQQSDSETNQADNTTQQSDNTTLQADNNTEHTPSDTKQEHETALPSDRIEIICVNDGSTDGSMDILNEYATERSTAQVAIHILSQANAGLSAARNAGMAIATGEYILFLDSDDCLTPDALAVLLPLLDGQTDIVAFNSVLWYSEEDDRKVENRLFNHAEQYTFSRGFDYLCRFVQQRGWGPSAACFYAYRRAFIMEYALSFPVGLLHEDELFVPQALCTAGRTCTLPKMLYLYRMRATSIAHTDNLRHAEDKQTIAQRLYDYFRQNGWRNRWTDRLVYNLMLNAKRGLAANGKRGDVWLLLRTAHFPKEFGKIFR